MTVKEFVTKAKQLVEEARYPEKMKEEMMRDTLLVFGIESDLRPAETQSRQGENLTYEQIRNLAK